MNPANESLWKQVEAFDLDEGHGDYPFSLRLADENDWTLSFTGDAILEYKKFMYLAAVSDEMVSPSPIVDEVWHGHLVFSRSYAGFCRILGKRIEHYPSTQRKTEAGKFDSARRHTLELYEKHFGQLNLQVWSYPDMHASLGLEKSRYSIRYSIILFMLGFIVVLLPATAILSRLYRHIDSTYFLAGYAGLAMAGFLLLKYHNRRFFERFLSHTGQESFLFRLTSHELLYLKHTKKEYVIHAVVNAMLKKQTLLMAETSVSVNEDRHRKEPADLYEKQVLSVLEDYEYMHYPELVKRLEQSAPFLVTAQVMDALRKYISKSGLFARLIRVNFLVISCLFLLGAARLLTGIYHGKPVLFIAVLLVVILYQALSLLNGLRFLFTGRVLVSWYERHPGRVVVQEQEKEVWNYFAVGGPVLVPTLLIMVNKAERSGDSFAEWAGRKQGDCGGGGCGSSCGGGCGGGCGGCGS